MYVEGFVVAVPTANKEKYRQHGQCRQQGHQSCENQGSNRLAAAIALYHGKRQSLLRQHAGAWKDDLGQGALVGST